MRRYRLPAQPAPVPQFRRPRANRSRTARAAGERRPRHDSLRGWWPRCRGARRMKRQPPATENAPASRHLAKPRQGDRSAPGQNQCRDRTNARLPVPWCPAQARRNPRPVRVPALPTTLPAPHQARNRPQPPDTRQAERSGLGVPDRGCRRIVTCCQPIERRAPTPAAADRAC